MDLAINYKGWYAIKPTNQPTTNLIVPVRIPSMSQIYLLKIIRIRLDNYTKNIIMKVQWKRFRNFSA